MPYHINCPSPSAAEGTGGTLDLDHHSSRVQMGDSASSLRSRRSLGDFFGLRSERRRWLLRLLRKMEKLALHSSFLLAYVQ